MNDIKNFKPLTLKKANIGKCSVAYIANATCLVVAALPYLVQKYLEAEIARFNVSANTELLNKFDRYPVSHPKQFKVTLTQSNNLIFSHNASMCLNSFPNHQF